MATSTAQPTAQLQATNEIWATTVLVDAGLPTTPNNVSNVMAWMTMEEPASNWWDRNNPLNASLGTSSTDGTGSYPSLTVGAQETAAMIRQSNMSSIYSALAANASPAQFLAGLQASPWAGSRYSQYTSLPGQPATISAGSGVTLQAGAGSTPTGTTGGCGAAGGGVNIFGTSIGSHCQLKALTGGLLVGVGGAVLLVGVVLIASYGLKNTRVGAAVGKVGGGPVGGAVGFVTGGRGNAPAPATPGYSERDVNAAFEAGQGEGAASGPSDATLRRWAREGFSNEGAKPSKPSRPSSSVSAGAA